MFVRIIQNPQIHAVAKMHPSKDRAGGTYSYHQNIGSTNISNRGTMVYQTSNLEYMFNKHSPEQHRKVEVTTNNSLYDISTQNSL